MKRKMVFGAIVLLLVLQAQTVFADYDEDFRKELNRNNIKNIENLLQKRAKQMDLTSCMLWTISGFSKDFNKSNCLDVLRLLVRYGADVNKQVIETYPYYGELGYPLERAIKEKHPIAVIQFLLDSGANPNNYSSTYFGRPPITFAYSNGDNAVVNLLLDRGAYGAILLPEAAWRGDNNLINQLINRGIRIRSDEGAKALRYAVERGYIDTVKLLVQNSVNVNARDDKNGATAASIAYDKGEIEIYNYLKANGAVDFEPRQTAQQPTPQASAPSTTNVYVQPSAPAPAPTRTQTPSTPTLQTGRYAYSGTNVTMELLPVTRFVTLYSGYTTVGNGSYNINGNTITITILQASGVASSMVGKTYAYTIMSDTSFSGNGETWYKR
jgi:ankyrin repeat protein